MATDSTMMDNGSAPSKKKRRGRCGNCGPCHIKDDCGQCKFCQNKQVLKQSCILRKCIYLRSRPSARGDDCSLTGCGRDEDDLEDRHPMSASSAGCPQSPYPTSGSTNSVLRGGSSNRQRRHSSYGAPDRVRGPGDESSSSPLDQPDGTSPKSSLSSPVSSSYDEFANDAAHGHHGQRRKLSIGSDHYSPAMAPSAAAGTAGSLHFESQKVPPSFSPVGSYAMHQSPHVQQPPQQQQQHHQIQDRSAAATGNQQHLGPVPPSCNGSGTLNAAVSSPSAALLFAVAPPLFGSIHQPQHQQPPAPHLPPPPPPQPLGYMWPLGLAAAAAAGSAGWRSSGSNAAAAAAVAADLAMARHRQQALPSPQIGGPLLSAFQHPAPSPGPCAVGSWPSPANQPLMTNHFAALPDHLSGVIARHSFGTFRPPLSRGMFGNGTPAVEKRFLSARDYIGGSGGIAHPSGNDVYTSMGVAELAAAAATLPPHVAHRSSQPPMRDILGTALAQSGIPENGPPCRDATEDLLADCCAPGDNSVLHHDLCDSGGNGSSGVDGIIASDSQIGGLQPRGASVDHAGQFCEDDFAKISGLGPDWLQMNTFDPVFPLHM